jgi:uncharacterized DUF497 family protein
MGSRFDPDKDAANIAKHGVSLVDGEGVLNDPHGERLISVRRATAKERRDYEG